PLPGEVDHYELHSLRYKADPGRYLYVRIDAGLKSFGGYVLGESVERILRVPEFPRELSIMHRGSLLALSGDRTVTVFSRNLPGLRVEIGRLLPKQLQHLVSQTYGDYDVPTFYNWAFDAANITERFVKIVRLAPNDPSEAQYEALDLGEYLAQDASDRRGIFLLRVQAWDPDADRPIDDTNEQWYKITQSQLADARILLLTEIGLIDK